MDIECQLELKCLQGNEWGMGQGVSRFASWRKLSFARLHLEQSSDGTNNTSNTEAAESETTGTSTATAVAATRGGRGSRGPGRAVKGQWGQLPHATLASRNDLRSGCR